MQVLTVTSAPVGQNDGDHMRGKAINHIAEKGGGEENISRNEQDYQPLYTMQNFLPGFFFCCEGTTVSVF